jgi:uncharacterized protein YajQ (UPF0234 family)
MNANLNIKDQNGHTILYLACIFDFKDPESDEDEGEDNSKETLNAEADASFSQIVEVIAGRCIQQVLDDTTS